MPFAVTATLSMLVVLGIMVLVHEFGHFIVAKLCGVRVEVFSIGFGTRLLGFRRGDTDYRLSLLPLGGYVKMSGENPAEQRTGDPGEFAAHPRWQRMLIGLAGPFANFILAFVLMTGLYMMHNEVDQYLSGPAIVDFVPQNSAAAHSGIQHGDRIVQFDHDHNPTWEQLRIRAALDVNSTVPITVERQVNGETQQISTHLFLADSSKDGDFDIETMLIPRFQSTPLRVQHVESGYPAQKAGVKDNDYILSVNGVELHSTPALVAYLQQQSGAPATLTIKRGTQVFPVTVHPIWADDGAGHMGYRLGFNAYLPPFKVEQLPFPQAVKHSVTFNLHNSGYILDVVHRLFTRHSNVQQLQGPIGIARQTGEAVSMPGWQPIIGLMALISLNLGIMNLLPIPILDGGMILLLLVEGTLRRDLNQQLKERIYQAAFIVLILFFAFIMLNDVSKLSLFSKLKP
ncbi:RIP metalloprotease RseP [Acidipila rosea]|uniref:Zinc metalloprotease n=1 Tax=Acidipila rosea TaxID=768535 RepID=A0A4R1L782_9BACT|nr:RIP metalloprotease RseP [Acidipila rosea]TCK74024.1 regulator of sigma E protease [Acidipila rosea]